MSTQSSMCACTVSTGSEMQVRLPGRAHVGGFVPVR